MYIYIYIDCVCDSGNPINSDQCGCKGSMDIYGIYGIVHPDNDSPEGGQQPLTKKFQHAPEAPGPPVSMLLIITNGCFFGRFRQALLSHNIEIVGPGVSNCPG